MGLNGGIREGHTQKVTFEKKLKKAGRAGTANLGHRNEPRIVQETARRLGLFLFLGGGVGDGGEWWWFRSFKEKQGLPHRFNFCFALGGFPKEFAFPRFP